MPTSKDFSEEIEAQIARAQQQGRPHVEVNAGELHRVVGSYPNASKHRMPMCCAAMRGFKAAADKVIFEPPAGDGASFTIRYRLPR